jgi:UDP-N-acetylglucosamine 1-carboxyvinyltransferase
MSTLLLRGGRALNGRVDVEGNKNAALPLMAACLLTDQPCVLTNVPRIADVEVMARLLLDVGAEVDGIGSTTLRIACRNVTSDEPDRALVGRLRGSVLLLGPLVARRGRAHVAPPGGDFPTRRTIRTHLEALTAMGARVLPGPGHRLETPDGLRPASIYLDEASVTGTETALLAAVAAPGVSEIRHAACEPHVVELCVFLRRLGAGVWGEGSPTIRVEGGMRLSGAEHRLEGDYIEAGSWAVVGAITGGEVDIHGARALDMEVVAHALGKMKLNCRLEDEIFRVRPGSLVGAGRVTTGLWPGFPSDLVSLVTVLATQADGATLVHDWLYELRLFALEQMSGMGADLFLCDPHRIIVTGPCRLRGKTLDSRDIRSGMALIAAALAADGESRVEPLETVERGYSRLLERLQGLGADVARVE